MLNKWKIVVSTALIFAGTSVAAAQSGGIPTIDVQGGCRAAEVVLKALFSSESSDVYESCVSSEQMGRDALAKQWDTFTARTKGLCVKPKEYLPSYVEWQTCLELTRDVMKMREAASQAAGRAGKSVARRQCPVVEMADDGNIVSVIAC